MTALTEVEANAPEINKSAGTVELNTPSGMASPQADPERQIAGVIHDEGRAGKQFGHGNQHNAEFATVSLQRGIVQFMYDDAVTAHGHVLDEKASRAEFFDKEISHR
jgi:hypothetical protein